MAPVAKKVIAVQCTTILAQLRQSTSNPSWRAALGMGISLIEKEFKIGQQVAKKQAK